MITKTILAFWTALCWAIYLKAMGHGSDASSVFGIFITGFIWCLIAVPLGLVGLVFKGKPEEDPAKIRRNRLIVGAAAIVAFALVFLVPDTDKQKDSYSRSSHNRSTYYRP
jgi:hypothetical protein